MNTELFQNMVVDKLSSIEIIQAKQEVNLEHHMKRCDALEKQASLLQTYINRVSGAIILLSFLIPISISIILHFYP